MSANQIPIVVKCCPAESRPVFAKSGGVFTDAKSGGKSDKVGKAEYSVRRTRRFPVFTRGVSPLLGERVKRAVFLQMGFPPLSRQRVKTTDGVSSSFQPTSQQKGRTI